MAQFTPIVYAVLLFSENSEGFVELDYVDSIWTSEEDVRKQAALKENLSGNWMDAVGAEVLPMPVGKPVDMVESDKAYTSANRKLPGKKKSQNNLKLPGIKIRFPC